VLSLEKSNIGRQTVVGPETLTGSSRMKGGSATKFLLETIFIRAFTSAFPSLQLSLPKRSGGSVEELLQDYELTCR